ncbi:thiamine-phosphate kinase [Phormidium pseudopriestleyi FRX01]|uniref:Thiamine-monophosphate kinase n=1 Tax=Phormidium pseudopriestleyi FRX01 TaxID=1759528 RepID=A0ABS3FRV5_9CYAN|nr:thiamine-phosphate kinase [Phormidium pseudopriestleyi]MBO0349836.1 thiamine-phosphate kinase [Phormidium pseudopriestleyi FRX01]
MKKAPENSPSVRELGEQGLLKRLQRFCPPEWVGDDAAAIAMTPSANRSLVVTTDMLVDGVHFSDRTTSAEDVGWRAAAANLSDLAAMGATPLAITVSLGLPGDTLVSWVEGVYTGMVSCLDRYQTAIAGGDVCKSPVNVISITAFGWVPTNRTIRRQNGKPGDAIVVTGVHGAGRAGLELLLHPETGNDWSEAETRELISAHQRPNPRLDVLPMLWEVMGEGGEIAGMDSSDGLADAIVQIARESGVGAIVDRAVIPLPPSLSQRVGEERAIEWALYGGEDFELVLGLPWTVAREFVKRLGNGAAIVGTLTKSTRVCLTDSTGAYADEVITQSLGFQHF